MFSDVRNKKVFDFFQEISQIPRGSGNEKGIADYLESFAKERGLYCYRDEVNNIFIRKKATCDEQKARPAVLLQGHTDMVCEADAGVDHDFTRDPIEFIRNGDILTANGTTLGADNGCAVAVMLAILDSCDIPHPDLECLFTVGEEVGMDGMQAFDTSLLTARKMINLDSAGEGVATVSCAGGVRCDFTREFGFVRCDDSKTYALSVSGLYGGHSGEDIALGRANAIEICARLLRAIANTAPIRLVSICGGDKDNAIPRSCTAMFTVAADYDITDAVDNSVAFTIHELCADDKGFKLELGEEFGTYASLSAEDSLRIIDFLTLFRSGPVMMSKAVEGMVESSYNLAVAKLEGTKFNAVVSFRSSEEASLDDLTLKMYSIGRVSGFSAVCRGRYPGWKYADVSPLRDAYLKAWKDLFGTEGIAIGIHAGLECGLLISRVPDMDIISIGPDIKDLHSPSESLGIGSFDRFYETVLKIIEIC